MIIEHCEFGSLKDFLTKHRRFFIDQIDHDNDQIDFNIGAPCAEPSACNNDNPNSSESPGNTKLFKNLLFQCNYFQQ